MVGVVALMLMAGSQRIVEWAIPFSRATRIGVAIGLLAPVGVLLGVPMPTGLRLLAARSPQMVAWAWGMNGALSVLGATLAIFIAMNWGFRMTLLSAAAVYGVALLAFSQASSHQ